MDEFELIRREKELLRRMEAIESQILGMNRAIQRLDRRVSSIDSAGCFTNLFLFACVLWLLFFGR